MEYHRRASNNAYCNYGFHSILTQTGRTKFCRKNLSVKLYMMYEPMKLGDRDILGITMQTRKLGMTTMVHAENIDMIDLILRRLEEHGHTDPFFHSVARPQIAENEATYRVINLSERTNTPILILHMSLRAAAKHVAKAQRRLLPVYAETCPTNPANYTALDTARVACFLDLMLML
ncbi:Metallo-dependent hydrolase [Xylona heveae TC161]|uniref:Metallo-dependent hydrolase n=1 Tax=Xylona heveae (strain CBS 132557 / TC161) TaxID=1328760 RepID=A0A164ZNB0_XYLHT|nr:Metallo-dependent hydrolase [Xylona heveae TC161]KZF19307.1 Metallo-dependent hydrolase [Xylona heveae TC161]